VDGTTVTMPDTEANQQCYPQQARQQTGLGFPIARVVGVICLSSGAVVNAAMGPYKGAHSSEHALLRQLLGSFCAGDVVLADRLYCSYFLIAALQKRGVDIVMPQHAMRRTDFRKGRRLTARDHVVHWQKPAQKPHWMSAADYAAAPDSLALREVEVGRNTLITTLLCDRVTPKQALKDLYRQRWHVELDLRCIKTVLGMERLSCTTPAMNEKELWVYLLAYNLIRLVMAQSALYADKLPRELSFKHTLQLWSVWSRQQFLSTASENITVLLTLIAQNTVGKRPGRIEPRCIKRRASSFPLLMKPRGEAQQEIKKHGHPKKLK
jgi:hypothetical protein